MAGELREKHKSRNKRHEQTSGTPGGGRAEGRGRGTELKGRCRKELWDMVVPSDVLYGPIYFIEKGGFSSNVNSNLKKKNWQESFSGRPSAESYLPCHGCSSEIIFSCSILFMKILARLLHKIHITNLK